MGGLSRSGAARTTSCPRATTTTARIPPSPRSRIPALVDSTSGQTPARRYGVWSARLAHDKSRRGFGSERECERMAWGYRRSKARSKSRNNNAADLEQQPLDGSAACRPFCRRNPLVAQAPREHSRGYITTRSSNRGSESRLSSNTTIDNKQAAKLNGTGGISLHRLTAESGVNVPELLKRSPCFPPTLVITAATAFTCATSASACPMLAASGAAAAALACSSCTASIPARA